MIKSYNSKIDVVHIFVNQLNNYAPFLFVVVYK